MMKAAFSHDLVDQGTPKQKSSRVLRNIYIMLAYAFDSIEEAEAASFATEEFEHLHDLCAEIMLQGVQSQQQRGLHHNYVSHAEELSTIRGRIDFASTLSWGARSRGAVVCEYDDYVVDTLHNQVLKCVLSLLLTEGEVQTDRRWKLRDALGYFSEVSSISPYSIGWRDIHYTRMTSKYRLMHGVCRLVIEGLLQREAEKGRVLSSWLDVKAESALYERFLLRYFQQHFPQLSVGAPKVPWDIKETISGAEQLPSMYTDVTMSDGFSSLIIDAKYYATSMQYGRSGVPKVQSSHLYQLLSYVDNLAATGARNVAGILLYAKTDEAVCPDLDTTIRGHQIAAKALDLTAPWQDVQAQLNSVVDWSPLNPKR